MHPISHLSGIDAVYPDGDTCQFGGHADREALARVLPSATLLNGIGLVARGFLPDEYEGDFNRKHAPWAAGFSHARRRVCG